MPNFANKKLRERENWQRSTGTVPRNGEMVWTKIMRKLSWSAPQLTTGLWAPLLRREYRGCQGMVPSASQSQIIAMWILPHTFPALEPTVCHFRMHLLSTKDCSNMVSLIIQGQISCREEKTVDPRVQILGWWHGTHPFGERLGFCSASKGEPWWVSGE